MSKQVYISADYAEYIGKNAIYGMIFHISTIKNSHGIYKEILHENWKNDQMVYRGL